MVSYICSIDMKIKKKSLELYGRYHFYFLKYECVMKENYDSTDRMVVKEPCYNRRHSSCNQNNFDIFPYLKNSGKQWYIFITRREIGGSLTHELLSMVVRLVPTGQNQRLLTLLLPLYKRKVTVVWQDSHRTLITSTLCA